jgi:metal-responsive CopG/Arc/MetJ family transcriptional regulator
MAVLTVSDTLLRDVDRFAGEELSREEFVIEATEIHIRRKAWEQIRSWGRELTERGVTEQDINDAIKEVRVEMRGVGK